MLSSAVGAVQFTTRSLLFVAAVRLVTASGASSGVCGIEVFDAAPIPAMVIALATAVYEMSFAKPTMVQVIVELPAGQAAFSKTFPFASVTISAYEVIGDPPV